MNTRDLRSLVQELCLSGYLACLLLVRFSAADQASVRSMNDGLKSAVQTTLSEGGAFVLPPLSGRSMRAAERLTAFTDVGSNPSPGAFSGSCCKTQGSLVVFH